MLREVEEAAQFFVRQCQELNPDSSDVKSQAPHLMSPPPRRLNGHGF